MRPLTHTLQHSATQCNSLHHTATHCNTLQHTCFPVALQLVLHATTHTCTMQQTATHCNSLQHTATRGNTPSSQSLYNLLCMRPHATSSQISRGYFGRVTARGTLQNFDKRRRHTFETARFHGILYVAGGNLRCSTQGAVCLACGCKQVCCSELQ